MTTGPTVGDDRPVEEEVAVELVAARDAAYEAETADKEPEIVTFSDLVRAHQAWEHELYAHERHKREPSKPIEKEFHWRWRQFEQKYGRVDSAYWSVRDASAVALTIREKKRWLSGY